MLCVSVFVILPFVSNAGASEFLQKQKSSVIVAASYVLEKQEENTSAFVLDSNTSAVASDFLQKPGNLTSQCYGAEVVWGPPSEQVRFLDWVYEQGKSQCTNGVRTQGDSFFLRYERCFWERPSSRCPSPTFDDWWRRQESDWYSIFRNSEGGETLHGKLRNNDNDYAMGYVEVQVDVEQQFVPAVFRNGAHFGRNGISSCGFESRGESECQGVGMWVEFYYSGVVWASLDLITYTGKFANKADKSFGCYTIDDLDGTTPNYQAGETPGFSLGPSPPARSSFRLKYESTSHATGTFDITVYWPRIMRR